MTLLGGTPGIKYPRLRLLSPSDVLLGSHQLKPIDAIPRGQPPGYKVGTIYKIGAEIRVESRSGK